MFYLKMLWKYQVATNAIFRDSNLVNGDDVGDQSVVNGEQKKSGSIQKLQNTAKLQNCDLLCTEIHKTS